MSGCSLAARWGCGMSDDRTPEEQLAEVALAALSGGLYALEHDKQLHELRQLREQLDLLSKWAIAHNDPDGRMLASVAMALRLLNNGAITSIVRRVAVTLQKQRP
jgi:hypothetical protein